MQHPRPAFTPRGWLAYAVLLPFVAAACGDGPTGTPPAPVPAALRVISGDGQSDTVDAIAATQLEVLVTDTRGEPSAGVAVQFTADLASGSASEPGVLLRTAATGFQRSVPAMTDARGTARVYVSMGHVQGPARVVASATSLNVADTAEFQVLAGAPARLTIAPRDTAVYVDGSFSLRVDARDRWGNGVPGRATVTGQSTDVTLSGTTVSGATPGRTHLLVQAGTLRDSTFVSVVPRGALVARRSNGGLSNGLVTFGLDGSQFRTLTGELALAPRFMRDGSVVFAAGEFGDLKQVTAEGSVQPFLAGGNVISGVTWPHPSRDGERIYFAQFSEFRDSATPTRVRRDGSGLEPVPGLGTTPVRGNFSPSPDESYITYFAQGFDARQVTVRVSRIGSAEILAETPGHSPEWSPTGEWIAYLLTNGGTSGPLRLMRPDGTGVRSLGNPANAYSFGIDWSPDGKWIAGATHGRLELVNVETGEVIPLPYSAGLLEPAWKP